MLLRAGEGPVTELAQELGMTQPGASKHLRVLREVGLVRDHKAGDREIVISPVIGAPRELVFEAFTEVRHLSRWWGPEGFTTTTPAFEFRVGGEWDFVMHGPDGTDYQEWISWTEAEPPPASVLALSERPRSRRSVALDRRSTRADEGVWRQ